MVLTVCIFCTNLYYNIICHYRPQLPQTFPYAFWRFCWSPSFNGCLTMILCRNHGSDIAQFVRSCYIGNRLSCMNRCCMASCPLSYFRIYWYLNGKWIARSQDRQPSLYTSFCIMCSGQRHDSSNARWWRRSELQQQVNGLEAAQEASEIERLRLADAGTPDRFYQDLSRCSCCAGR